MFSEVTSTLKNVIEIVEVFKNNKFKTIATIFITLSIVLIKPMMYYSTLYTDFCKCIIAICILGVIFFIGYIVNRKKHNEFYHDETVNCLLGLLFVSIIIMAIILYKYENSWLEIYDVVKLEKSKFITELRQAEYVKELYNYVISNFAIVLLYAIEYLQTISITYLVVYILYKLVSEEEPLITGFVSTDWEIIVTNILFIIFASPFIYPEYLNFWNKIF